jgi:hypothetical protein
MTALLCSLAISLGGPCPDPRGGHALPIPPRGGHALVVLEPTGPVPIWVCIHRHEAAWNDRGDPYWGGLQMDRGFMGTYGRDMIRRYRGRLADAWSPRDQMVVAWRAVVGFAGFGPRGYGPWPNTRRGCA